MLLQVHADETNRGRNMSLFGLINRGLGPVGSFPFGLIASGIGFGNCSSVRSTNDCFGWVCRVLPGSVPSGSVRGTHRYQPPTVRNSDQPLKKLGDLARWATSSPAPQRL